MRSKYVLAAQAARLNREAGQPAIPALYFFTDPERTPDPVAAVKHLPRGTAVVFRHFGAPGRRRAARRLAAICSGRGLYLLVAADPELALRVGADGVHWPEQRVPSDRDPRLRIATASAHSSEALARASAWGADACVLAPVFRARSAASGRQLGLFHASQLARACNIPVIALGGVNADNAHRLAGRGFAGLAAVEGLAEA